MYATLSPIVISLALHSMRTCTSILPLLLASSGGGWRSAHGLDGMLAALTHARVSYASVSLVPCMRAVPRTAGRPGGAGRPGRPSARPGGGDDPSGLSSGMSQVSMSPKSSVMTQTISGHRQCTVLTRGRRAESLR
jgi:hypothetical protein